MADFQRSADHQPVQTSAVVILNAAKRPLIPPPSPPTPSLLSPADSACETPDSLDLNASTALGESQEVDGKRLCDGLHVLQTEAAALASLSSLYQNDTTARRGFVRSVDAISRHRRLGGRLIIAGVGKSGHIGRKLVATFQSLAVPASFLHPTEALHGDLGLIGPHDVVMLITFSGKTAELMQLIPHIDDSVPLLVLTGHTREDTCAISRLRPDSILVPAPVPEPEATSFGVAAPTTSTTAALAVGDALAIAVANELHPSVASVFAKNHPGGAIGAAFRQRGSETVKDIAVTWETIPTVDDDAPAVDLLRAGFGSAVGWVRIGRDSVASADKIRSLSNAQLSRPARLVPGLVVGRSSMICLDAGTRAWQAASHVRDLWVSGVCSPDTVVAAVDDGEIVAVVEVSAVLRATEA